MCGVEHGGAWQREEGTSAELDRSRFSWCYETAPATTGNFTKFKILVPDSKALKVTQ